MDAQIPVYAAFSRYIAQQERAYLGQSDMASPSHSGPGQTEEVVCERAGGVGDLRQVYRSLVLLLLLFTGIVIPFLENLSHHRHLEVAETLSLFLLVTGTGTRRSVLSCSRRWLSFVSFLAVGEYYGFRAC